MSASIGSFLRQVCATECKDGDAQQCSSVQSDSILGSTLNWNIHSGVTGVVLLTHRCVKCTRRRLRRTGSRCHSCARYCGRCSCRGPRSAASTTWEASPTPSCRPRCFKGSPIDSFDGATMLVGCVIVWRYVTFSFKTVHFLRFANASDPDCISAGLVLQGSLCLLHSCSARATTAAVHILKTNMRGL